MNRDFFIKLRNLLVDLYPAVSSIRRVVDDAELAHARIEFTGTVIDIWYSVLTEAVRSDKIDQLLAVIQHDYGSNKRFQQIHKSYTGSPPVVLEQERGIAQPQPQPSLWLWLAVTLVILVVVAQSWQQLRGLVAAFAGNLSPTPSATVTAKLQLEDIPTPEPKTPLLTVGRQMALS